MNAVKILAVVLIVAGILGLAYGSFSYTKETHEAKLGPIELSVKDKQTVNIPVWAGVGAIVVGVLRRKCEYKAIPIPTLSARRLTRDRIGADVASSMCISGWRDYPTECLSIISGEHERNPYVVQSFNGQNRERGCGCFAGGCSSQSLWRHAGSQPQRDHGEKGRGFGPRVSDL